MHFAGNMVFKNYNFEKNEMKTLYLKELQVFLI